MKNGKLNAHRRRLEALLSRLRPEVTAMTDQTLAPAGGQGGNELSNAPFHLGDTGTEEYLHDLNATLLENEEYLTNEVRAALKRIDDGEYGRCESCGKPIAETRLEALPYTRYCIKCADKAQSGQAVNYNDGRPMTADDTLAPEGEMGELDFQQEDTPFRDRVVDAPRRRESDVHAVGEPGGGTGLGGLAGTNVGRGDPVLGELEEAMGSGEYDADDARNDAPNEPRSGRGGGAVGGTPANKRAKPK
ncbi:MAG TPA: TraR/DksA C4-type zinc finger protein [Lacipirellula sp.]